MGLNVYLRQTLRQKLLMQYWRDENGNSIAAFKIRFRYL